MVILVLYFRGNKDKALELYDAAVNNSRSILEMQQGYLAREVFTTQVIVIVVVVLIMSIFINFF